MFDKRFRKHWQDYLLQPLWAAITVLVILLLLSAQEAVIVASIGASAFIVFAMPSSVPAHARNVIGGQFVGLLCGGIFNLVPHSGPFTLALICALAVGFSILVMVSTNTEHPPASGTALALALDGASFEVIVTVLVCSISLSLVRALAGKRLRDLV